MTLRGLTTTIADFDALIASAALTTDREVMIPEEDGSALTARAEVRLTVAIPTYLNAEEIGEIAFTVCYFATLTESTITLSLNSEDAPSLDLFAKVENAMELLAYVDVSYTEEAGLLLRESESGIYHMPGCKNIAGKATAVSHIALLEEKSPVLCNECNPLSFVHSLLVTDDEHYHIPTCKALGTDKSTQSLRETSPHLLMADGLTPCPDCIDENLPEGDLEARLEKAFSALAENEDTALRGNANMAIGVFNATLSGIDRQRLELSVNLDFITPSSAGESTSEIYTVGYHYRVYNGRMVRYTDTDTDFCRLEFYICGFEVKYE